MSAWHLAFKSIGSKFPRGGEILRVLTQNIGEAAEAYFCFFAGIITSGM